MYYCCSRSTWVIDTKGCSRLHKLSCLSGRWENPHWLGISSYLEVTPHSIIDWASSFNRPSSCLCSNSWWKLRISIIKTPQWNHRKIVVWQVEGHRSGWQSLLIRTFFTIWNDNAKLVSKKTRAFTFTFREWSNSNTIIHVWSAYNYKGQFFCQPIGRSAACFSQNESLDIISSPSTTR